MINPSSPPVLIAGAGPSGLVLALALAKNGIAVRIVDKELNHRVGQRGAGITPRTLEAYNLLGILPDVLKQGEPMLPMRLYELPGGTTPMKTWKMSEAVDPTPAIPYPNSLMLGQNDVEALLRTHLERHSIRVELGTALHSFEQRRDSVVAHLVKLQDGHEVSETVTCSWLIGADGARGVVRKQLGLTFLGETRDQQHIVVGDIHLTGLDRDHWHLWGDSSNALVALRPTGKNGDTYQFAIGGANVDTAKLASGREELVKFLQLIPGRTDINYGDLVWISDYRPNIRMVDKFGDGRVFVAGDAAHVHSPTGGQGMNSSVQDSFNLAWKLALVEKGLAPVTLLSAYTEERLPVIAEMLNKSTVLLNKTLAVKKGDETPWKRGKELHQLGINCRWSPIVLDERVEAGDKDKVDSYGIGYTGGIYAGDRAPDAPELIDAKTHATTTLFQTYGPSFHTVLVLADRPDQSASILEALRSYPAGIIRSTLVLKEAPAVVDDTLADLVLVDEGGYAYRGYAVSEWDVTVIVIRPDGVVGAIVRGAEGVDQYFKGILLT